MYNLLSEVRHCLIILTKVYNRTDYYYSRNTIAFKEWNIITHHRHHSHHCRHLRHHSHLCLSDLYSFLSDNYHRDLQLRPCRCLLVWDCKTLHNYPIDTQNEVSNFDVFTFLFSFPICSYTEEKPRRVIYLSYVDKKKQPTYYFIYDSIIVFIWIAGISKFISIGIFLATVWLCRTIILEIE